MKHVYLEKKLTLNLRPELNWLDQPEEFWRELTATAGVRILKHARGVGVRAFLLAESSLLVWQRRLILMTCGSGEPLRLLPYLERRFGPDAIEASIFENPEFDPDLKLRRETLGISDKAEEWSKTRKTVLLDFSLRYLSAELKNLLPRKVEIFQDHDFEPVGYSCNACDGESFFTLHFSPDEASSCLSFESRGFDQAHEAILQRSLQLLHPQRVFHP